MGLAEGQGGGGHPAGPRTFALLAMASRTSHGQMNSSDVIIVGAGPAGLASAASMAALGLDVTVLEKANAVGSVWRRHYDRLHLHTDRGHSSLPGMAMPRTYPTYPSREQVIEYLENYAAHFQLHPVFNTTVLKIAREGSQWMVETTKGRLLRACCRHCDRVGRFSLSPPLAGLDVPGRSDSQQRLSQHLALCR